MGANTFWDIGRGANAQEAFRNVVADARHRYGHGGYTGTIAEKDDFVQVGGPLSWAEAKSLANKLIDEGDPRIDDKWGPAGCVEIAINGPTKEFLFFGWASS